MERVKKIALIGANGFNQSTSQATIRCFPWTHLHQIDNLKDYDSIVVSLLGLDEKLISDTQWSEFHKHLNPGITKELLHSKTTILVLGDPRFDIPGENLPLPFTKTLPFLSWTGMNFTWDEKPGNTVISEGGTDPYTRILKHLTKWKYSLKSFDADEQHIFAHYTTVHAVSVPYACNRYSQALLFTAMVVGEHEYPDEHGHLRISRNVFDSLSFIPEIDLTEKDTISLVLQDVLGVESSPSAPDWIIQMPAPGQEAIDNEINRIQSEIEQKIDHYNLKVAEKEQVRSPLKLLYSTGQDLEEVVRYVLSKLGAEVIEPTDPGKEDGWLKVKVTDILLEAVLEVKSTRNAMHSEHGLRQLFEWKHRGAMQEKEYKGLFIGVADIETPPASRKQDPFSNSWKTTARMNHIAALRCEDLFTLYALHVDGVLDLQAFWQALFNTDGVFNINSIIPKSIVSDWKNRE